MLFTEMISAPSVIYGDRDRLLGFSQEEHPIVAQLGGGDPVQLAESVRIMTQYGYDGIDLNCGCPSSRVRAGSFGASMMLDIPLVARCIRSMKKATHLPISVKCRIGVDDQEPSQTLPSFIAAATEAGVDSITVHARKALLDGISPKKNRRVPPLDYQVVHDMKRRFPDVHMVINGGISSLEDGIKNHLSVMDGIMLGRTAYKQPLVLTEVDSKIYGDVQSDVNIDHVIEVMMEYARSYVRSGGKMSHVTRHMLGILHGVPNARSLRRTWCAL